MKTLLLLFFICSTSLAYALEAVVTVLEAPLFRSPSYDAPVVQYKRKGDVIKIHPSLANTDKYDILAPTPQKRQTIRKRLNLDEQDEKKNTFTAEDEFIPTLDRQGRRAYILASHLYVYYEDRRELDQNVSQYDPTDYRLQEPLPKNYPFKSPKGFRGQALLGFTQPYTESYPYLYKARTKGYMNPIDFNLTYLKNLPSDTQDRFYYGGTFQFKIYQNTFSFDDIRAEEKAMRFGIGPYVSYDAYKGVKNRINVFASVNFYFFNEIAVTQHSPNGADSRNYRAFSLSPRAGLQYHRKSFVENMDFVAGTSVEFDLPTTYKATEGARVEGLWKDPGTDHFSTRGTFNLAGFLGIQAAY